MNIWVVKKKKEMWCMGEVIKNPPKIGGYKKYPRPRTKKPGKQNSMSGVWSNPLRFYCV